MSAQDGDNADDYSVTGMTQTYSIHEQEINLIRGRPEEWLRLTAQGSETYKKACFTGLRVYEGAELLAHFLTDSRTRHFWAGKRLVELGTGVGLVPTAAAAVPWKQKAEEGGDGKEPPAPSCLVATDGEKAVLELARRNISSALTASSSSPAPFHVTTEHLLWDPESVRRFLLKQAGLDAAGAETAAAAVVPDPNGCFVLDSAALGVPDSALFDFVLGADLVYARISLGCLVATAAALMARKRPSAFLLTYHARVSGSQDTLREACKRLGMALRFLKISATVPSRVLLERQWPSMEFALISRLEHLDAVEAAFAPFSPTLRSSVEEEEEAEAAREGTADALFAVFGALPCEEADDSEQS